MKKTLYDILFIISLLVNFWWAIKDEVVEVIAYKDCTQEQIKNHAGYSWSYYRWLDMAILEIPKNIEPDCLMEK